MNITKIGNIDVSPYNPTTLKKSENSKKIDNSSNQNTKDVNKTEWQKDILLSALDNLENKIQTANNHPLDKVSNAPIETNEEAMIELSFLNTDIYKEQAFEAQANINAEDVYSLFADSPELITA